MNGVGDLHTKSNYYLIATHLLLVYLALYFLRNFPRHFRIYWSNIPKIKIVKHIWIVRIETTCKMSQLFTLIVIIKLCQGTTFNRISQSISDITTQPIPSGTTLADYRYVDVSNTSRISIQLIFYSNPGLKVFSKLYPGGSWSPKNMWEGVSKIWGGVCDCQLNEKLVADWFNFIFCSPISGSQRTSVVIFSPSCFFLPSLADQTS